MEGERDLIFPHHENEISQSEAATGKPFVRYWIHNGFVNINKEKMSKSLGNILTIKEMIKSWHPRSSDFFSFLSIIGARLISQRTVSLRPSRGWTGSMPPSCGPA